MKNLLLSFFTILSFNLCFSNKIDRLKTTEDVEKFVKKVNPEFTKSKWTKLKIPSTESLSQEFNCSGIFDKWEIKNWEKTDLNNDGKTDLLFTADYYQIDNYAIIDDGLFKYSTFLLTTHIFEPCQIFKPIRINKKNLLKIYTVKTKALNLTDYEKTKIIDTLTFKYDQFVEVNKNPLNDNIKSIEYSSGLVSIKIKSDGIVYYNGHRQADVEGSRLTKISSKEFKDLENLLNYIKIKELKEKYSVTYFHGTTSYLKITFDDNSKKEISDYGSIGTYGLSAVYKKIETIVKNKIQD